MKPFKPLFAFIQIINIILINLSFLGLPEYGVDPFDPFYAQEVHQKMSGPFFSYKLILRNVSESGWTQSQVTGLRCDLTSYKKIIICVNWRLCARRTKLWRLWKSSSNFKSNENDPQKFFFVSTNFVALVFIHLIKCFRSDFPKDMIQITQFFPDKRLKGIYEIDGTFLGQKVKNSGSWNLALFDYIQTLSISRKPQRDFTGKEMARPPIKVKCNIKTCKKLELHIGNLAGGRTIIGEYI